MCRLKFPMKDFFVLQSLILFGNISHKCLPLSISRVMVMYLRCPSIHDNFISRTNIIYRLINKFT